MERETLVSLVTAAQSGDSTAMNTLFNEFYDRVYYFALKTVKDESLACDITQETFVEIINTLHKLEEPAAFVTRTRRIAYHQCTRYFRKKKDVLVDEDEDGNTMFDDIREESAEFIPDEALDKDDFKKTIHTIIDQLPEEQRAAALLYYFDELKVAQIAEIQGVSENTVKSRLNYARKAIRASVEDYEKKHGVKLHTVPFIPLFKFLFEGTVEAMPMASATAVAEGVAAATGTTLTVTSATAAATAVGTGAAGVATAAVAATATTTGVAAATTTAVGIGAKLVAIPLVTKVIAGVAAAAIVVGGGTAAAIGLIQRGNDKKKPQDPPSITTTTVGASTTTTPEKRPVQALPIEIPDVLILEGTIPNGCTYTQHDGTVLNAGDPFPETCVQGDKVSYLQFDYYYECVTDGDTVFPVQEIDYDDFGYTEEDMRGSWYPFNVRRISARPVIATRINGKPIRHLYATFHQKFASPSNKMLKDLVIPETVFTMIATFQGNPYVVDASELKIPDSVINMTAIFYDCQALTSAPAIPDTVVDLYGAFEGCVSLTGEIEINSQFIRSLNACFADTVKPINLVGKSKQLKNLALTGNNGNVTVFGQKVVIPSDPDADTPVTDEPIEPEIPETPNEEVWEAFIVPAGCRYEFAAGGTVSAGGSVTVPPEMGDTFITPDYTYRYRQHAFAETADTVPHWIEMYFDGWGVMVNDRSKSTYPALTSTINGKPLLSMDSLFDDCAALTDPPAIPQGVIFITNLFDGCRLLTESPTIPDGVLDMCNTFRGCTSLTTAPVLPNSVLSLLNTYSDCTALTTVPNFSTSLENMVGTFTNCTGLKSIPSIPASVIDMHSTFEGCIALESIPNIPNAVTRMTRTFYGCTALKSIPNIPNAVTDMSHTFAGCTALESVPPIPTGVRSLYHTFYNCSSLSGTVEIHANLTITADCNGTCSICSDEPRECHDCYECYEDIFVCFEGTLRPIQLTGSCAYLKELANTSSGGNVTVK